MKNLFSYEGKRCLITGCFSGMGEATARIVQSLGGEVVPVDIKKPTTFPFEKFYEVDLKDPVAIEQMIVTIAIAWIGTLIGVLLSLPIGFLALGPPPSSGQVSMLVQVGSEGRPDPN